jgi:hypothetical protein
MDESQRCPQLAVLYYLSTMAQKTVPSPLPDYLSSSSSRYFRQSLHGGMFSENGIMKKSIGPKFITGHLPQGIAFSETCDGYYW